jgi:hypothetical protein
MAETAAGDEADRTGRGCTATEALRPGEDPRGAWAPSIGPAEVGFIRSDRRPLAGSWRRLLQATRPTGQVAAAPATEALRPSEDPRGAWAASFGPAKLGFMTVGPPASGRLVAETAAGDEAYWTGLRCAATEPLRPSEDSSGAAEGVEAVPLMAMPVAAAMPEGRPGPESHGTSDSHTMGHVKVRRSFGKRAIVPDSHGCTESESPRPGRRNRITTLSRDNTKPGNTGHAKTGRHEASPGADTPRA